MKTPETFEDLDDGSGNRPLLTPEEEAARLVAAVPEPPRPDAATSPTKRTDEAKE